MKYLLATTLVFWVLTFIAWKTADRPGDDFGAAALPLLGGGISLSFTLIYIGFAFWNHRLL